MQKLINLLLKICKWPAAIYLTLSIPAYIRSVDYFSFTNIPFISFAVGFFMFFIARTLADKTTTTTMQTIAHELTHTFFAFLTFHKVKAVRVNPDDTGGNMEFQGEGNWLIIIAPYFFPLFAFFFMIGAYFYLKVAPMNFIINGIIGYLLGYHVDTVSSQIHEKQTDLPLVGYPFCFAFLPGANMNIVGSVLAFNSKGWEGISLYQQLIYKLNIDNLNHVLKLL